MKRFFLLISLAAVLTFSCNQDAIFLKISQEVKPLEPRVKGVPTKMVVFEYTTGNYGMYVASSDLYRYAGGNPAVWNTVTAPSEEKIIDLAATTGHLYALTDPDSPRLWRAAKDASTTWNEITFPAGTGTLAAIYGATDDEGKPVGDRLFISSYDGTSTEGGNDYGVFTITDIAATPAPQLAYSTGLLTGAANDNAVSFPVYFFSTKSGIYVNATPYATAAPLSGATNINVSGLIQIDSSVTPRTIVALCYNGDIYNVTSASATKLNSNAVSGFNLRGPAAVWTSGANKLLLAAISTPTGAPYGYREIDLTSGPLYTPFTPGTVTFRVPGADSPTTVDSSDSYYNTIGSKPMNAILQAPAVVDTAKTLFASIQGTGRAKNNTDGGLWSYRSRDGVPQWNAEE